MRLTLRQINEKSKEVARVSDLLGSNLKRLSKWDEEFCTFVFNGKKKEWPKLVAKEHERANRILRSTSRLIREAIKALIPNINHEEADDLTAKIVTKENILSKFDNVAVEFRRNSIF